jgi:hypothetical protein
MLHLEQWWQVQLAPAAAAAVQQHECLQDQGPSRVVRYKPQEEAITTCPQTDARCRTDDLRSACAQISSHCSMCRRHAMRRQDIRSMQLGQHRLCGGHSQDAKLTSHCIRPNLQLLFHQLLMRAWHSLTADCKSTYLPQGCMESF